MEKESGEEEEEKKEKKEKFRGGAKCEKDTINSRVCHVAADTTISVRRKEGREGEGEQGR